MEDKMGAPRKVYQYDINGYFIKEWKSLKEASSFLRPGFKSTIKMNRTKDNSERSF